MSIKFVTGNIFDSKCDALVNPVNCVGVMGAGLAKQFKIKYPQNFTYYTIECDKYNYKSGDIISSSVEKDKHIINLATKRHWKNNSTLSDIILGLTALKTYLFLNRLSSCAIPAIGCGLGGLQWKDVKKLIVDMLLDFDVEFEVYESVEKI